MENKKNFITIILNYTENEIIMEDVEKNQLMKNCKYFEIMFGQFNEKDKECIIIRVPVGCAGVMKDIIMSFISEPIYLNKFDQLYTKKYLDCCNFFCIKINNKYFDVLEIDNNNIESLIQACYNNYNDNDMYEFLRDKIPDNYDVQKLSKNLIQKILDSESPKILCGRPVSSIDIICTKTGSIRTFECQDFFPEKIFNSPNGEKIMLCGKETFKLYRIKHKNLINIPIDDIVYIYDASFSADGKIIAALCKNNLIRIWCTETGSLIKTLVIAEEGLAKTLIKYYSFLLSPNGKLIAIGNSGLIHILSVETNKIITTIKHSYNIFIHILFSHDSKLIVYKNAYNDIMVYNLETVKHLGAKDFP